MSRQVHITVPTIQFTHRYPRRRAKVQNEETAEPMRVPGGTRA